MISNVAKFLNFSPFRLLIFIKTCAQRKNKYFDGLDPLKLYTAMMPRFLSPPETYEKFEAAELKFYNQNIY